MKRIAIVAAMLPAACLMTNLHSEVAYQPVESGLAVESREQLNAVLWTQTAIEYRANTLSVYRAAERQLAALRNDDSSASVEQMGMPPEMLAKLPRAIILDLDETVLDNSPHQAALVMNGAQFDGDLTWRPWVEAGQATEVAGAVSFLTKAQDYGFQIFYVTNRACMSDEQAQSKDAFDSESHVAKQCADLQATMDNLKTIGAPRAREPSAFLLRYGQPDWKTKGARRAYVAGSYRISMMLGDDLKDFVDRAAYREEDHARLWGTRWFMLPNAQYGSWLSEGIFGDFQDAICKREGLGSEACQKRRLEAGYSKLRPFTR